MANALLIQEPPLQVLPTLAQKIGLNEAIILQQIHYWLNPKHNKNIFEDRHWVWNTYEQWQQQFPFWGEKTIRRAISNLEDAGLLDSFVTRDFRKLKYYTINYNRLEELEKAPVAANKDERPVSPTSIPSISMSISENLVSEQIIVPTEDQSQSLLKNNFEKFSGVVESLVLDVEEITSFRNGSIIGFRPSGQNDQIDLPKRADRSGQIDQIDRVILTRCINIDTENTLSENTLHPLNARESDQMGNCWTAQKGNEEEEKENSMTSIGSFISQIQLAPVGKRISEKEEEKEKIKLMIGDWNRFVQSKISPNQQIFLTPKRAQSLAEILDSIFQGNLRSWQIYCRKIANTRFLMGENNGGFKITLDWALNVHNAVKILEGAIYDKTPSGAVSADKSWEELRQEIRVSQAGSPFADQWLRICEELLKVFKQPTFRSWFLNVRLQDLTSEMIILEVENDFTKNYLSTQLKFDLERAIRIVFPSIRHIEIITQPRKENL